MKTRSKSWIFFIILVLILASCYFQQKNISNQNILISIPAVGQITKISGCVVNGALQDKACTPGAIISTATVEDICRPGYSKEERHVTRKQKKLAFTEYGVTDHSLGEYEVDHLIPLELGGSNDIANLWPEAAEPRPGFHEKDKVESYLHKQVCHGKVSLQQAQQEIAADWAAVYKTIQ